MEKKTINEELTRDLFKSEIRSKDEESRTVEFVISTPDKDRHGTVLNQANWDLENFNANPIVGYQHDVYGDSFFGTDNPDTIIGKAEVYVEEKRAGERQLIGKVTFEGTESTGNELAEKVFKKIQFGSLSATSVGFKPLRNEKGSIGEEIDGVFHYYGQELLEFSVVKIPSNPKAIKRTAEFFESFEEEQSENTFNRMVEQVITDDSKEPLIMRVEDGKCTYFTRDEKDVQDIEKIIYKADLEEAKKKELEEEEKIEADRIQRELQFLRYKLDLNKIK